MTGGHGGGGESPHLPRLSSPPQLPRRCHIIDLRLRPSLAPRWQNEPPLSFHSAAGTATGDSARIPLRVLNIPTDALQSLFLLIDRFIYLFIFPVAFLSFDRSESRNRSSRLPPLSPHHNALLRNTFTQRRRCVSLLVSAFFLFFFLNCHFKRKHNMP